jgi:hypothetical protein
MTEIVARADENVGIHRTSLPNLSVHSTIPLSGAAQGAARQRQKAANEARRPLTRIEREKSFGWEMIVWLPRPSLRSSPVANPCAASGTELTDSRFENKPPIRFPCPLAF